MLIRFVCKLQMVVFFRRDTVIPCNLVKVLYIVMCDVFVT